MQNFSGLGYFLPHAHESSAQSLIPWVASRQSPDWEWSRLGLECIPLPKLSKGSPQHV